VLVLIVDRDVSALETYRRHVSRFGYRCEIASDGAEAWERIVGEDPDVILTSLGLGAVDGLELCRRVRQRERHPGSYVVALVDADDGDGLFAAMAIGADDFVSRPLGPEQLHARLQVAERFTLLARQLQDEQSDLERARSALRASARTDTLTQLWNRVQLNDDLELFQGQFLRYGHRYAAVIVDVDRFRAYNDANGQLAGDEALRVVAQVVARQLRTGDRAYRYGGDQLMVLLPEQTSESACVAGARIREAVEALGLPHHGNPPRNVVTVSAGIAAFQREESATYEALLRKAEAALARAKADGGNRVAHAD
jgi:diguanylate cyclase (GGDEF)-like protein